MLTVGDEKTSLEPDVSGLGTADGELDDFSFATDLSQNGKKPPRCLKSLGTRLREDLNANCKALEFWAPSFPFREILRPLPHLHVRLLLSCHSSKKYQKYLLKELVVHPTRS